MNIEQQMKNENRKYAWKAFLLILFLIVMTAGFVLGCVLFRFRPKESVIEKRELTAFPEFDAEKFADGTYTSNIEKWFADTFPLREQLLALEGRIKNLYGFQQDVVSAVGEGDDIPDLDELIGSLDESTAAPETQVPETQPSGEATMPSETAPESESESESETEPVYESVDAQELVMMNPQEAGNVNVKDNIGYCVYGFNLKGADKYAENVANVANALKGVCDTYEILIPDNSAIMLDDETRAAWKLSDEEKVLHYYHAKTASLSDCVKDVYIYDVLKEHNDEYLYFYTDHHWTQLGAYYAYVEFCKAKGIEPHALTEYKQVVTENFLGSYYATNGYTQLEANPDTVYAYEPLTCNTLHFFDDTMQAMREGAIIRDMSPFANTLKYLGFIYGDNSYSTIESPEVHNGEKCIVIKESFGNAWIPFLTDHYEKIIVLDYRTYTGSVVELAKQEGVNDVIFINNLEAISDAWIMDVLGNICR